MSGPDADVLGGEGSSCTQRLCCDDPVERVARGGRVFGQVDHPAERESALGEPDSFFQLCDDAVRCLGELPDLMQVAQLKSDHGGEAQAVGVEAPAQSGRKSIVFAGIQPHHDVSVEVKKLRHGCTARSASHSCDQSMDTNSSASPAMTSGL